MDYADLFICVAPWRRPFYPLPPCRWLSGYICIKESTIRLKFPRPIYASVLPESLPDQAAPSSSDSLWQNAERRCDVHGLALWFDVLFQGSTKQTWLSTAPGLPTTHWSALGLTCLPSNFIKRAPHHSLIYLLEAKPCVSSLERDRYPCDKSPLWFSIHFVFWTHCSSCIAQKHQHLIFLSIV